MTNTEAALTQAHTRVVGTLSELIRRDVGALSADKRIVDDLGLDSTNILELLMKLEDEFGVEFDPDTFEPRHFETIGTLTEYVAGQAEEQQ
jgi:acyl carrier protein